MNIPDEAVTALAAEAISDALGKIVGVYGTSAEEDRDFAEEVLATITPAIERAHLEQLTAEADAEWNDTSMHSTAAYYALGWLRARLDQTTA